ncbi:hypothetical protein NQ314_011842 [Rhamnusium bicolor]|uniref:Uncharacterized protein n=1 Tax=Rhamnusium bicolor TaxID=1586634 RepID=A0AAV8XFN7_9CUCU|nr:hypothetical protein NQ314_011842 [Rhamnusium bicolor]
MVSRAKRMNCVFENEMSTSEEESYDDTDYMHNDNHKLPIPRKTAHPWEENNRYPNYPTPESNCLSSPDHGLSDELTTDLLNDIPLNFPIDIPENELLNSFLFEEEKFNDKPPITLEEHNYNATEQSDDINLEDDVGVCLHVSKHRLSLEFCSSCSENATQSWLN